MAESLAMSAHAHHVAHFLTCRGHLHLFVDIVRHRRSHSVSVNEWCVRHAIRGAFRHVTTDRR